jgi:S1-C subfamily serine protease
MPEFDLTAFSDALAGLASAAAPALVAVEAGGRHGSSAFHWRDGLYVGASEAIETDDAVTVTDAAGKSQAATLVGRDPTTGIALLKTAATDAVLQPAAGPVEAGALALSVGRGEAGVIVGLGVVAEAGPAWRSMRGALIDRRIRLQASLDPRLEGGAALDAGGGLIGLVLFGPHRRPLVIPAETVERVVTALASHGHVPRGYLGAALHPIRQAEIRGAMVMSLDAGGPAATAGLVLGDVITAWDGEPVEGVRGLIRRLGPDSVGNTVVLGVLRGGKAEEVSLTVGARPAPEAGHGDR